MEPPMCRRCGKKFKNKSVLYNHASKGSASCDLVVMVKAFEDKIGVLEKSLAAARKQLQAKPRGPVPETVAPVVAVPQPSQHSQEEIEARVRAALDAANSALRCSAISAASAFPMALPIIAASGAAQQLSAAIDQARADMDENMFIHASARAICALTEAASAGGVPSADACRTMARLFGFVQALGSMADKGIATSHACSEEALLAAAGLKVAQWLGEANAHGYEITAAAAADPHADRGAVQMMQQRRAVRNIVTLARNDIIRAMGREGFVASNDKELLAWVVRRCLVAHGSCYLYKAEEHDIAQIHKLGGHGHNYAELMGVICDLGYTKKLTVGAITAVLHQ